MIRLYDETETEFINNGIKTLHPYKCDVFIEDNGDYYCEIEDSIENIELYIRGRLVLVETKWGNQAFEIQDIEPKNNKIYAKMYHVYYRSENYVIKDTNIVDKNIISAMKQLNDATDNISPFSVFSDINNTISHRCIRKSLNEGFSTLLERSGGHLVRDNFNVKILAQIGEDRGVTLSYRKNIKSIEKNVYVKDWLCTKVLPVGKDGLLLDEIYVSSKTTYNLPYTKVVSFEQDILEEDYDNNDDYVYALKEDLLKQSQVYLEEHCVPKINFTVNAGLDYPTQIGDTIHVKYEPLNIDLLTNVISIKYDAISRKYKEIQFGNFKDRLSNLIKDNDKKISKLEEKVNPISILAQAKKEATDLINHPFNGYIYIDEETGSFYIMDTTDPATAQNVWKWSLGGLGFSSDGINGTYGIAITQDGKVNADYITTGVISTEMIEGYDLITQKVTDSSQAVKDLEGTLNTVKTTLLEQTGDKFTMWFEQTGVQGTIDDLKKLVNNQNTTLDELRAYIRYGVITDTESEFYGSPYAEFGKEDAQTKLRILKDRIQFLTGETETAYISNNALYINESTILTKQVIGQEGIGKWITEIDEEGNLNTYWGGVE